MTIGQLIMQIVDAGKNLSLYSSSSTHTSIMVEVTISLKTFPYYPIKTCKLDARVNFNQENGIKTTIS